MTHPVDVSGLSCHLLYQHTNYKGIVDSAHFRVFITHMNIINNNLTIKII